MKNLCPSVSICGLEAFAFIPVVRGQNKLEVRNEATSAEIVLIGAIGKSWWDDSGITEQEVRDALKSIPSGKPITIKINSEGGSVKEGLGIYNAIKDRRADITCRITGYALSIASVFPLAAGRVVSPKSAIWMMHKAWSYNQGNADDMRQAAEMLDTHDETLIDIYAAETGKSKAEIRGAMEKETWVKGKDAVAWGLADETDEEDAQASYRALDAAFVSRCKNISPEILNAITAPNGGRAPALSAAPNKQGAANTNNSTTDKIMNRAQMLALLKTWGVTVNDSITDDELVALVGKGKPQSSSEDPLAKVQAQLAQERLARITAEVTRRAENKIANDKLEWWINMAVKDESGTLAQIESLPAAHVGAEPLGPGSRIEAGAEASVPGFSGKCLTEVENMFKAIPAQPADSKGKLVTAEARYSVLKENWESTMAKARAKDEAWVKRHGAMPVAANTYSATLVTNFLILGAVTQLSPKFAAAKAFARDNSVDPFKPLATGVMKFTSTVQDGSTTLKNPTNWETGATALDANNANTGDSTVDPISITVDQYSERFHVTNSQLNSGLRMEDLTVAKLASLGSKCTQVLLAPATVANFTADPLISAPGAFGFSDMTTLWGQLKKSGIRNIVMDGEYLARIINTPTLFQSTPVVPGAGWKNVNGWDYVALNTDWTGAGANVRGIACNPQAIGMITGLPLNPPDGIPGNTLMMGSIALPGVDITIAVYVWFSLATRTLWASYDLMLGAAKLDGSAAVLIKSA